jgi:hypothetical protein
MRWGRPNRRFGSWLALIALALQLALSFGHVHLDGIGAGSAADRIAGAKAPSSPPSPAQHPTNDADDYCAICATIHLASTSFLPPAPQLPVPFVSQTIEHFSHVAFVAVARQRTPFQSRAPPLA